MKPKQLEIRVEADTGNIYAAHRSNRGLTRIRDITEDVLLCLCAKLAYEEGTEEVVHSVQFSDGMQCRVVATMIKVGDEGYLEGKSA